MGAKILTKSPFQIKLIRCEVGDEKELIQSLKKRNTQAYYGKVFGKYDIIEIRQLRDLHDALTVSSNPQILNINTLPCFTLNGKQRQFKKSLRDAIAPSLILLKLNSLVFSEKGIEGIYETALILSKSIPKSHILISLSYFEIFLWVESDNFEDIFNYTESLRKFILKDICSKLFGEFSNASLIVDSITVPSISYKNVVDQKKWNLLSKKISPIVNIKCVPGYEQRVAKYIQEESNICRLQLGSDDILCFWKTPLYLSHFTKMIIEFRNKAPKNKLIDTVTKIYSLNKLLIDKKGLTDITIHQPAPQKILEYLETISQVSQSNQFFIRELINIISLINTLIGNSLIGKENYEEIYSIMIFMNDLILQYKESVEKEEKLKSFLLEGWLLSHAFALRSSISQQFSSKSYSDSTEIGFTPTFASSLIRIKKAISLIPEQLFGIISKSTPPNIMVEKASINKNIASSLDQFSYPWVGFIYLDLEHGYGYLSQGEIFVAPHKDIFQIYNWVTLTHEVSHAYYYRIDFETIEIDFIEKELPPIGDIQDKDKKKYIEYRKENIEELFAHWFDYKHFFNSDFSFYIWSIWRTYLEIPRVYTHKYDYWGRSLFIWFCHNKKNLKNETDSFAKLSDNDKRREGYFALFRKGINELISEIQKHYKDPYDYIQLNDYEKTEVAGMCTYFIDFETKFEKYTNEDLIKNVNYYGESQKLDLHLKKIINGEVITEEIPNPFLLLKSLLYIVYKSGAATPPSNHLILSFILSFWETSKYYHREPCWDEE